MDSRLEIRIDKCRDMPSAGVVRRGMGTTRIVEFMELGEEVEKVRCGDVYVYTHTYYIYIYIYMCVCVCLCRCVCMCLYMCVYL